MCYEPPQKSRMPAWLPNGNDQTTCSPVSNLEQYNANTGRMAIVTVGVGRPKVEPGIKFGLNNQHNYSSSYAVFTAYQGCALLVYSDKLLL